MATFKDAMALAKRGVSVFPLRAGTKDGFANDLADHGATVDELAIFDFFRNGPANFGCYAGRELLMVDIDAHHGGNEAWAELVATIGAVPATFTVKTPNGGRHLYFRVREGEIFSSADLVTKKINIRAVGGYVVGPGSTFDGRPYVVEHDAEIAPLPDNLRGKLAMRGERSTLKVSGDLDTQSAIDAARNRLAWAPPAVQGEGGDLATFKLACELLDYGLSVETATALMLELWDHKNSPPWYPGPLERKVENAWEYRTGEVGRDNPQEGFTVITLPGPFESGIRSFDQTAETEAALEIRKWIASRRLLRSFITGLIAPGGVGKSVLSIMWGAAIALGDGTFCGLNVVEQTNVLIINNEDPQAEMDLRAHAIFKHFKLPWAKAHGKLMFYSGYGAPIKMAEKTRDGVRHGVYVEEIISVIKKRRIGVLIVDPLISTHRGMDENSNTDMDELMTVYKYIAAQTGVAILDVCHTKKPPKAASDDYVGSIDSLRGASAIKDAMRLGLTFYNMSEQDAETYGIDFAIKHRYARLDETEKFNLGLRDPTPQWFERKSVELTNSAGLTESLGVLEPVTFTAKPDPDASAILTCVWDSLVSAGNLSVNKIATLLKKDRVFTDGDSTIRRKVAGVLSASREVEHNGQKCVFTPIGDGGTLALK